MASGQQWEYPVSWGTDLQAEHERYLVEKHFGKPVILTGYPKDIKAFYMKMNEDGKTVRAMDVLFPKIGEIIGGSQREEDLDASGGISIPGNSARRPMPALAWALNGSSFSLQVWLTSAT